MTAFFLGSILFGGAKAQAAASLYLSPPSGTFVLGNTFTVNLYVNTGGQSINAVEANLSFPPDKLQIVSPTTGKSFIQVWVAQPTYSNENGALKFQGTIPTPGINTEAGLISTVTFRVKSIGTAAVKIMDTSHVLLNDGRGTDVLGETTNGIYYLTLPPAQGPVVTSRTNPDQEKWYNNRTVVFEWSAPADIEGYSYVLDQDPILEAGHYIAWTQLKVAGEASAPSSRLDLTVAKTAIQIGGNRLSYQDLYLILFIIFALAFLALLSFFLYHIYHFKTKNRRLASMIKEAEDSIRRGFSLLRHDIEAELALFRKMKPSKELSVEEKLREEKLLKDLEMVNGYVGKELWKIEEAEK